MNLKKYLHFSSVNCLRTSPTIYLYYKKIFNFYYLEYFLYSLTCPTLCNAFKSFSDLSNSLDKVLDSSLTFKYQINRVVDF